MTSVVKKQTAAGLKLVLVDKGEHRHVELETLLRTNDGVVLIHDLFKRTNDHRSVSHLLYFETFLLLTLLLWLEQLLVLDELLLH